jgi:tetratricopeptide repeat protein 21B
VAPTPSSAKTLWLCGGVCSVQTARHGVLEAYVLIVSKNRVNLEQAVQQLGAILSENPNDVRALLALATALMVLKQTPKARNQLKRIAKMPYNSELADQFVQSYLLLADIYISSMFGLVV